MFNNELMADVHFVVGPPGAARRVPAHKVRARLALPRGALPSPGPGAGGGASRGFQASAGGGAGRGSGQVGSPPQYVLAVGSSVFYAMFYGDLAEVKSEIHIPDVEPAAFLILLK